MTKGTRIYYTGDMANNEGFGTIVSIDTNRWGTHANIDLDDGRDIKMHPVHMIKTVYKRDSGTRIFTVAAVNAYWSTKYPDTYKALPETAAATQTHDLGNNETVSTGIAPNNDGTYTALTRVESKTFKTERGAFDWLARRGYHADGTKAVH